MEIGHFLDGKGEQGKWYVLPSMKGKPKAVEILIRCPKPSRTRELRSEATIVVNENGHKTKQVDEDKIYELIRDECIVDWKNIDHDGKPFPCNTENKKILDENWNEFNLYWNKVYVEMRKGELELLDIDVKNLLTGLGST